MKYINKIAFFCLGVMAMTSCVENKPDIKEIPDPDVNFTYNVDGDAYALDYYVVSTIKFNNTSAKTGNFVWDFGDGETSTEASPLHKYAKAGEYTVKLTIDGVGYKEAPITIFDITPQLSVASQSTDIIEINDTKVDFAISLPNPENLKCRYEWTFPEGTLDESGNPISSFTGYADENGNIDYPGKVTFKHLGSQRILLTTYFDIEGENRRLEDSYLNVQVGSSIEAPTLYYAQKDGNIKAVKLIDPSQLPTGTKILPYDMGVKSGNNPFQLAYADVTTTDDEGNPINEGWVYILDAGKQYYYINDENGVLGDGMITAMKTDGTGVNTVITNVGGAAFNDPFQGFVADGKLYYTDRGTGISAIDLTARGQVMGQDANHNRTDYIVKNDLLAYYNRGIAYGAIHAGIYKSKGGVWYWAKNYSGNGIYRFKESDIHPNATAASKAELPYSIMLQSINLRCFTIDETRNALYVWRLNTDEGFYHYNLPAESKDATVTLSDTPVAKLSMDADPVNTTDNEGVFTTQLAVDPVTGRVYFGFRPTGTDSSKLGQGLVYYDPNTKKCSRFGDLNDAIYGVVINPNKSKLF